MCAIYEQEGFYRRARQCMCTQQLPAVVPLQGGKAKMLFAVSFEDKLYEAAAQVAIAVKDNNFWYTSRIHVCRAAV